MRGVFVAIPPRFLDERKRMGADRWDEMWDGELHRRLVLLTPARFHVDRNERFDGGPDVVVEIRSPGDESLEKLSFYARVGALEAWIVDRDSRDVWLYDLATEPTPLAPEADGWLASRATGLELRTEDDRLAIRLAD